MHWRIEVDGADADDLVGASIELFSPILFESWLNWSSDGMGSYDSVLQDHLRLRNSDKSHCEGKRKEPGHV